MKSSITLEWAIRMAKQSALEEGDVNVQASRPTGRPLKVYPYLFVETGAVIGKDGSVLKWHEPENSSGGYLPDNRALWEFFRDNWKDIQGFAHSHPEGCTGPSGTDLSTFAAIELGLDLRFDWWIVTSEIVKVFWYDPVKRYETFYVKTRPSWADELISRSYGERHGSGI